MTPVFISQRSPSKNRENLKELLDSVGLDYYDRFEWMLRTETRCGDDNFFVVRKPNVDNKHKKINIFFIIKFSFLCIYYNIFFLIM